MKLKKLKKLHNKIAKEYIRKFSNKQGLKFDYWVGDNLVGGNFEIASFINQYFFSLSEIIYDINSKQPVGLILDWQEHSVDSQIRGAQQINYYSYSLGLRYEHLNDK